ncbi:MAG: hypothetical protein JSS62_07240 [Verrucomicrobia bacterium]|nr:hypothetical protein [Verrucomicrobiota bacterium]MBS0645294.1 hypothetical protein [Verrucomicrobiota bacterium]
MPYVLISIPYRQGQGDMGTLAIGFVLASSFTKFGFEVYLPHFFTQTHPEIKIYISL